MKAEMEQPILFSYNSFNENLDNLVDESVASIAKYIAEHKDYLKDKKKFRLTVELRDASNTKTI